MKEPTVSHVKLINQMVKRARQGFGPADREAVINWLIDHVDGYLENAVRCDKCGVAHLPVTKIGDEYVCPHCYGADYANAWEDHWETQAEAKWLAEHGG